ncbi:hypothetical protein EXN66_Car021186 [Channa argus]|uniref:Uncharacterized protein n=1 Tax=Channa argus TaxID=215402 RepID=A0A6G1QSG6_CHAAH|nr:hypothetical protein EXN66_Car021186 [Channa argus]
MNEFPSVSKSLHISWNPDATGQSPELILNTVTREKQNLPFGAAKPEPRPQPSREMLGNDLKRPILTRRPKNMTELKQFRR